MAINFDAATNYSWMSQASYLDLSTVVAGNRDSLILNLNTSSLNNDKIFAADQATSFTDPTSGYSLISQLPNTTNGTSLTVFKSNSNTDGSYTIAVRGTEPFAQMGTDLAQDVVGVVAAGKATVQLFEAFRYYKKGFSMCLGEMKKLVEAIQDMPKPEPKNEEQSQNEEEKSSGDDLAFFVGID